MPIAAASHSYRGWIVTGQTDQTDDQIMRAVIHEAKARRSKGWKTSADHLDLRKLKASGDRLAAEMRAYMTGAASCP